MSNHDPIDLRSDTVTKPTVAMRKAMAEAEVGDDVFGEDPTVIRLQERVAELLGKEASLFVPSGTMANQLGIAAQTRPGDEILMDDDAHILNFEGGAPSLLSGVQIRTAGGDRGRLSVMQVQENLHIGSDHEAPTTLVCLENTHNRGGGSVYDLTVMKNIRAVTEKVGVRVHLDGARLWNAAVNAGVRESDFAECADSVSVCFSKGLGAPVGSAISGNKEFIRRAHRFRKIFGGGMRQAGILAAAALYALDNHRHELALDHEKARWLAEALLQSKNLSMDGPAQSNILYFNLTEDAGSADRLMQECAADGVLFFSDGPRRFRLVTHRDVSMQAVQQAAQIIARKLN